MDFTLKISRDNVTYYQLDLFPDQELYYDLEFFDEVEIDKVKIPFYTELRIPLTDRHKGATYFNFNPDSSIGGDFPKEDFYFQLDTYGANPLSVSGIMNVISYEYNSNQPYIEVVLKDFISKYLSEIKGVRLGDIYSDTYYTTRHTFEDFLLPTALGGEAGTLNTNPEPSRPISFPYIDFCNDVDGKFNYAARQFLEYGPLQARTGIAPVFSVPRFLDYLGQYISTASFPLRIDSKLFATGAFAGSPFYPDFQPEKLHMVIPAWLKAKSDINTRTFSIKQSPAWAWPNTSLISAESIVDQSTKLFSTDWFGGSETAGNYGPNGEGEPLYPILQEWGGEKTDSFYPFEPAKSASEPAFWEYIRGWFSPKVSFNAALSVPAGTGAITLVGMEYEIPVIQEDKMVRNINYTSASTTIEWNLCIGVYEDGAQRKEIVLNDALGNPLVIDKTSISGKKAGYSNKTDSTGEMHYRLGPTVADGELVIYENGGTVFDVLEFSDITAYMPSGEELFVNQGSLYAINYYLKPIGGEIVIDYPTEFVKTGSYWSANTLSLTTGTFGINDITKAINRIGPPAATGNFGALNVTFTANQDYLPYKKTDEFIIQESINDTCPYNVSDVLLRILKRFDCNMFYSYDSVNETYVLRVDPMFIARGGTVDVNGLIDDLSSYKITDRGDKVKTLTLNNEDYRLFYDDLDNDDVTIGSTTQDINTEGIVELKYDFDSSIYYRSVCGDEVSASQAGENFQKGIFSEYQVGLTPNVFTKNTDIGFRFAYLDKPTYQTNLLASYIARKGLTDGMITEVQVVYSSQNFGSASTNLGGKHVFNGRLFHYNTAGWSLLFEELGVPTDSYTEIFAKSEKIANSEFPEIEFDMVVPTEELNDLDYFSQVFTASRMTGGTIYPRTVNGVVYDDYAKVTIKGLLK